MECVYDHTHFLPCVVVSWCPCLEQLACIGYQAVATHLPLMLRQWHLTLDRQTSAFVSGYIHVYVVYVHVCVNNNGPPSSVYICMFVCMYVCLYVCMFAHT